MIGETAGATLQIAGNITDPLASPGYSVDVELAHPQGEVLVETLTGGIPKGAALGALHLSGKVSGDRSVANFADVEATIGESTLGGGVFLRIGQTPPAFSADLHGGVLDLAWLGGGLAASKEAEDGVLRLTIADVAGTGVGGVVREPARWSDETIDLAVLDRLSGTLALDAEALVLGDYRIDQANIDLAAAEGALTLRSLTGRLFDGALKADGSLAGGSMPAGQAAFRLADAELGDILRAAARFDTVSGKADADGYFTLGGETEREIVQSLTGRVALTSSDGTMEGVDVPAVSRQIDALSEVDELDDIASFVERTEQSLSRGQTAIRSLDGTVRVQNGQARIDGFGVVMDGGVGDISGTADLPAWQLDLTALFRLTEHADAPPVGIRFKGPIDRPERRYLIADMQAHLVKLGLLSLAGAPDMPKITLRKGAKAEPGTEMDRLLRNVLGDPDEADAESTEAAEDAEQAGQPELLDRATTEQLEESELPGQVSEPAKTEPRPESGETAPAIEIEDVEEVELSGEPDAADGGEESSAPPPVDEPVPHPPPAPERYRDEILQDVVDDLLKEPEPDQDEDFQDFVDDLLKSLEE